MYMEVLLRRPLRRLKRAALAAILCVGLAAGWLVWMRFSDQRTTDRELLHEAVAEWQCAGEHPELSRQIFEQQASRGYYDDAAATGHLLRRPDEVQWSVVELARVRAENGDLSGAKTMMKRFAGSDLGTRIADAISLAQVTKGDLASALEFAAGEAEREEVFLAYARHQINNGDFAEALDTAARMESADQVFYEVAGALAGHNEQKRIRELGSGMKDHKLAGKFEKVAQVMRSQVVDVQEASPCEIASTYADQGRFAEAYALIQQHNCTDAFVAIKQYEVDPAGAEHLLRSRASSFDLLFGLDQLAVAAAKKGNISDALRFFSDLHNLKESTAETDVGAEDRVTDAANGIARYWTIKDGARVVVKWARSRTTCEQRAWALLGIAQALGH